MAEKIDEFFGFEFKIDGIDDTTMSNNEDAFIFYLKVDNKTQKSRKINLLKATYVTSKREQLEQDTWLLGYLKVEDTIKPNSFKKAGLVFHKSKLKTISDKDVIYISIELTQEGSEITLSFQKTGNNWLLINKEKTEIEIKLTPKQLEKKLLNCIERLDVFEERLNVNFENISIRIDPFYDLWFELLGELHTKNGTELEETCSIECILYDNQGSIINQESKYISKDSFFGFEVFKFNFQRDGVANEVNKIRIYPKK
jgi:hypothetical protein